MSAVSTVHEKLKIAGSKVKAFFRTSAGIMTAYALALLGAITTTLVVASPQTFADGTGTLSLSESGSVINFTPQDFQPLGAAANALGSGVFHGVMYLLPWVVGLLALGILARFARSFIGR